MDNLLSMLSADYQSLEMDPLPQTQIQLPPLNAAVDVNYTEHPSAIT